MPAAPHRNLKKLEVEDLLSINTSNGDVLVTTKQETAKIIKDFIYDELGNLADELVDTERKKIQDSTVSKIKDIERQNLEKIDSIERSIEAFIDYRFDKIAEKLCEKLITRKFEEEVNRKVNEKLKEIRGKF